VEDVVAAGRNTDSLCHVSLARQKDRVDACCRQLWLDYGGNSLVSEALVSFSEPLVFSGAQW
jgi:hypothetical protein